MTPEVKHFFSEYTEFKRGKAKRLNLIDNVTMEANKKRTPFLHQKWKIEASITIYNFRVKGMQDSIADTLKKN